MLSPSRTEPVPPMVSAWTPRWGPVGMWLVGGGPSSGTWPSANRGIWQPVYIPATCVARRAWWFNGTAVAGNVEGGIYLDGGYKPGAKLITTGSVAQSGTSVIQFGDLTDTVLPPGLYWLYLSCSSASATIQRSSITDSSVGTTVVFEQSSIGPGSAPATATPVEYTSTTFHAFGFSTTTIT